MTDIQIQSPEIDKLFTALSKAQADIRPAFKDAKNSYYGQKYSSLGSVQDACRDALIKNGFAITQAINTNEAGQMVLITTLGHSSGQWLRSVMPIVTSKPDIQALGSAISYSRRYALAALVGVVPNDDDDGEAAMDRITKEQVRVLLDIMTHTDKAFQERVSATLKKNGWKQLADMSQEKYDVIYSEACINRDMNLEKK